MRCAGFQACLHMGIFLSALSAALAGESHVLIPSNAQWSYYDRGAPPAGWQQPSFDDTLWPSGTAKLGYGEGDENTEISRGPGASPYPSAVFRRWFEVPADISAYNLLVLGILRDDGAVVYLNGVEIYRSNMPSNAITPTTYAVTNVGGGAERVYYSTNLAPAILQAGTNLLAVAVHQSGPSSDDFSFNLRLVITNVTAEIVRGPYLQSGSPNGVVVCWRTSRPTDSLVRWGLSTNDLSNTNLSTELRTDHAVAVTGLTPDTRYYYAIGNSDGALDTNSAEFYFVTAPTNTRPFRIWAIGDAGTAGSAQRSVRDAYEALAGGEHTDVWLMLGDNAYPTGTDAQYENAVFRMYTQRLPNTLLYPALGNHETYHTSNPDNIDYLSIFSNPANGEAGGMASGTELYYSFDYANAHFICLDSMINDRSSNGFMYAWLEQDLAATTKEWIIAFWHHPPYTKGSHDSDAEHELIEMRENILPLLEANGVDLVLCGHSHCYERSFLVHGHYGESIALTPQKLLDANSGREEEDGPYRKTGPQGAVYVVAGSSGQTSGGPLDHPVMFTSLNELGSLVIDINDKRLHARFLRESGSIDDWFTMTKEPAPLQIVSIRVANTGVIDEVTITWTSTAGKTYQVWRTDALDAPTPAWVPAGVAAATGSSTSWSEPVLPPRSTAFYRVSTDSP